MITADLGSNEKSRPADDRDRPKGVLFDLGVVSNREQAAVDSMLSCFFPGQHWWVVVGAGEFPNKPDPTACLHAAGRMGLRPQEVALVGDTEVDVYAARNAGMTALAVSWGFRPRGSLEAAGATTILDDPSSLAELLSISLVPRLAT